VTSLTCQPDGVAVLVADVDVVTLFTAPLDPAPPPRSVLLPSGGMLVRDGHGGDQAWLVRAQPFTPTRGTRVALLDTASRMVGSSRLVPTTADLFAADDTAVWLVEHARDGSRTGTLTPGRSAVTCSGGAWS